MKGVPGLLIAVGLGIIGAFCNLFYLSNKVREFDMVDFVAIGERQINVGDKFNEGHFIKVSIPKMNVGNLEKVAVHWRDLNTVIGEPATKSYSPNDLLFQKEIRTPPAMDIKRMIAADEMVLWIPVDTRTFVPQLVNAGDQVSFLVPRVGATGPTPADGNDSGGPEYVGPFRILALGNRLGSQDVQLAAGNMPSQENVMAVAIKVIDREFEPKAKRMLDVLQMTNFQQVHVMLHASPEAAKGR